MAVRNIRLMLYKEIWAGYLPTQVRIWKFMGKCCARFQDIDNNRINKRIFEWCIQHGENRCRNWYFNLKSHIISLGLECLLNDNAAYSKTYITEKIYEHEFELLNEIGQLSRTIKKEQMVVVVSYDLTDFLNWSINWELHNCQLACSSPKRVSKV